MSMLSGFGSDNWGPEISYLMERRKVVPAKVITECVSCPFEHGGVMLESTCSYKDTPDWHFHDTNTPLVGIPEWCPLKDTPELTKCNLNNNKRNKGR